MKNIQFKAPGAMLVRSPEGKMVRKAFDATVELPFSEDNLHYAEEKAVPNSVQVYDVTAEPEADATCKSALDRICLADRQTGSSMQLYVENGKLMMEVL